MATAGTIIQENVGSLNLLIVPFTAISSGDTWVSGLGSTVVAHIFQPDNEAGTASNAKMSAGTATFYGSGGTITGNLFVFAKQ